jgi:hypothetical protein
MSHQWNFYQFEVSLNCVYDKYTINSGGKIHNVLSECSPSHPNFQLDYLKYHPENNWDYDSIINKYGNKFWIMLVDNPTIRWNWLSIFRPFVNVNWNLQYPPDAYKYLSNNKHVTIDMINKYKDMPWDFLALSLKIPFKDIIKNQDLPWRWDWMGARNDFDWSMVDSNLDKPWDWNHLTTKLTLDDAWYLVAKYPNEKWCYKTLSKRVDFTWDIFRMYHDKSWDMKELCYRDDFKWKYVEEFDNVPWNFAILCKRDDFTWELYKKYSNRPWDYATLCSLEKFDWKLILEYPDKPWDYTTLANRKDFDMDVIAKTREKWSFKRLSKNKNMTEDIVKKYMHLPWRNKWLILKRNLAAKLIQQHWKSVLCNPYHPIGYKYILREFKKLNEETPLVI